MLAPVAPPKTTYQVYLNNDDSKPFRVSYIEFMPPYAIDNTNTTAEPTPDVTLKIIGSAPQDGTPT